MPGETIQLPTASLLHGPNENTIMACMQYRVKKMTINRDVAPAGAPKPDSAQLIQPLISWRFFCSTQAYAHVRTS